MVRTALFESQASDSSITCLGMDEFKAIKDPGFGGGGGGGLCSVSSIHTSRFTPFLPPALFARRLTWMDHRLPLSFRVGSLGERH